MWRAGWGAVLLSFESLLTSSLSASPASSPESGSPGRLFRNLVMSGESSCPRGCQAEAQVEVNFNLLMRAGALQIDLPDGSGVVARRVAIERRSPDHYTWRGRLTGPEQKGGDVVLTVSGGAAAGVIFNAAGVYQLIPRAGGEHRLARIHPEVLPDCAGAVEPPAEGLLTSAVEAAPSFPDPADRIDILVVYTQKARVEAGGTAALEATIRNAVDLTHTAYANSQIAPGLKLVHMEEIDHREARQFSTDLFWVRDDARVNALRDLHRADMVALIVHNLTACGIGFLMSKPSLSFAPNAYQVTAWDCAGPNLTFPHEFGHIQGADHNPEDASGYPTGAAYPWSYGHFVDGSYRTVMSYSTPCVNSCPRHPYFSNPNVLFSGFPTGVEGERENYRTLNDSAIYVANFRQAETLCGNGLREAGELCDGADFGGLDCTGFGCTDPGTLGCAASCDSFDLSGCSGCPAEDTGDSGESIGGGGGGGGLPIGSPSPEPKRSSGQ